MTWINENVFMLVFTGIAIAIVGFVVASQLNKRSFWAVGVGGVAMIIASMLISHLHLTPEEQVKETIYELARLVENEDYDQLKLYFDEGALSVQEAAIAELTGIEIVSCRITRFESVEVNNDGQRPKASARFVANADINASSHGFNGRIARRVTLNFELNENNVWKIQSYSHSGLFSENR